MHVSNFKIYKPYGYISQFVNNQPTRRNKKLLGDLHSFPDGIMAIGRLDEDSEGLLLLTTSGKTSEEVRSKNIEKEYYVQVDGMVTPKAIEKLRTGIEIGVENQRYITLPSKVSLLKKQPSLPERNKKIRDERHGPTSWISIVLTEGKFRQIRKMTAAAGFPTLRLVKIRIGNEVLGEMLPGEVIPVEEFSLKR